MFLDKRKKLGGDVWGCDVIVVYKMFRKRVGKLLFVAFIDDHNTLVPLFFKLGDKGVGFGYRFDDTYKFLFVIDRHHRLEGDIVDPRADKRARFGILEHLYDVDAHLAQIVAPFLRPASVKTFCIGGDDMKTDIFKGGVLDKGCDKIFHRKGFVVVGMERLMDGGILCEGVGDKEHGIFFFGDVGVEFLRHIANALEILVVFKLLGALVDDKDPK